MKENTIQKKFSAYMIASVNVKSEQWSMSKFQRKNFEEKYTDAYSR